VFLPLRVLFEFPVGNPVYFIRCPSRLSFFFMVIHSTMRFVVGAAVLLGSRAALAIQVGDDWEGSFVDKRQAMIQHGRARFVEDPDSEPFDNMGSDFYAQEEMPAGMQRRMEMEETFYPPPPDYVTAPASAPGVVHAPAGDPYAPPGHPVVAASVYDPYAAAPAYPGVAASVVHEHVGPTEKIVRHIMDPPAEHVVHHPRPVEHVVHHASPPIVTHVYDSSRRTDKEEEFEEDLIRSPELDRSMLEAEAQTGPAQQVIQQGIAAQQGQHAAQQGILQGQQTAQQAGERPLEEWAGSTGHGWDDDHFEHHEHDDDYDNGDHNDHHGHGRGHDHHNKGHSKHHHGEDDD